MFSVLLIHLLSLAVSQRGLGLFLGEIKVLDYCGTVTKPQFMPSLWSELYCNFSHRQNNSSILHMDYYTSASGRKHSKVHWESDEADLPSVSFDIHMQNFHHGETTQGDWLLWPIHVIAPLYIGNRAKWIFHMDKSCFHALFTYHMVHIHFS